MHSGFNSDDSHNFYNDIDNSNDDDDNGNNNDIYNNDKYHYPSELGQMIRIGAFVCLLLKEFRILIDSIMAILPHIREEVTCVVGISE